MGVFLPLALLGPWLFRKATSSSGSWHWRAYASFAALVLDSLQGLPTLKAFARGKARGQEIAEQSETLYRATMRILAVNLWSTGVMDLAIAGGAAVALAVGALRAVEGHIGGDQAVAGGEVRVLQEMPPLPAVAAGGVLEHDRDARAKDGLE